MVLFWLKKKQLLRQYGRLPQEDGHQGIETVFGICKLWGTQNEIKDFNWK